MKNEDYNTGYAQATSVIKAFGSMSPIGAIESMYDAQFDLYEGLKRSDFDSEEEYEARKSYLSGYLNAIDKYLEEN